jgi:hypothetical protein
MQPKALHSKQQVIVSEWEGVNFALTTHTEEKSKSRLVNLELSQWRLREFPPPCERRQRSKGV